jgi:signal transduction histidine kinase
VRQGLGSRDAEAPRADLDEARLLRLLEVGRSLVSELDLDEVLHRLLDVARELTGARYAAIGVLDEPHTGLSRFLTSGLDAEAVRMIGDPPAGHGVLGELIRTPAPLRLDDVGAHPRSYGYPPNHPPMTTFLGVPILVLGAAWGNLYLTEKDVGSFTDADEQALLVLADWASIAIRNAGLYRAERTRRSELERTVEALEATMSIARALGAETDFDRVLELVTKRGRALVEARVMVIALFSGGDLVVRAIAGAQGSELLGRRLPVDGGLVTATASGAGGGERLAGEATRLRRALAREVGASSGLLVPLRYRDETVGVLAAFDRAEGVAGFSAEEERLLEAFAASAATAVVTAQRVAASTLSRRVEAAEQERARWARELHDENLQDLAGLKILLSSARRGASGERLASTVDEAIQRLSVSIESLRGLIADLRPAALDQLGVSAALEGLAERTRSTTGVEIGLRLALDEQLLSDDTASTVYRLVQESLTNVAKHAGATRVDISVSTGAGAVEIEVRDNGGGFDPLQPAAGFGLVGMRERVELAHGSLRVEAAPGSGTIVRAHIPLADADFDAAFASAGPAA